MPLTSIFFYIFVDFFVHDVTNRRTVEFQFEKDIKKHLPCEET